MNLRVSLIFLILSLIGFGFFLFLNQARVVDIALLKSATENLVNEQPEKLDAVKIDADIEPQKPLLDPPQIIKAIYATNWSAGSEKKLAYLIKLIKDTELNALVIDIKDFSGYVGYNTKLELPKKYDAVELRIPKFNKLIKRLHDEGIYLIGRISVFQDQRLAIARPDLALHSKSKLFDEYGWKPGSENSTGSPEANKIYGRVSTAWKDHKGLTWMDAAAVEVWDYNAAIAEEILDRGFDEVNFDYIRFASDGNLNDIRYPFWDEKKLKVNVLKEFFRYLWEKLPEAKLSADLFGLATISTDGVGIGQHLEYALPYFDAIAPMLYPSHYFQGSFGYQNPAVYPYEIVKQSLEGAVRRINEFKEYASTTPVTAKLRPWLQDFDLGADYDAVKVRAQIQAVDDVASSSPELFDGWMIWNASNIYTKDALKTGE